MIVLKLTLSWKTMPVLILCQQIIFSFPQFTKTLSQFCNEFRRNRGSSSVENIFTNGYCSVFKMTDIMCIENCNEIPALKTSS